MSTPKTGLCKLGAARKFAARPGLWMWAIRSVAGSLDDAASGKGVVAEEGSKSGVAEASGCGVIASCWDASDGVGSGETAGVAVGLAAVVAGVCCCEKPKPSMSSGRDSRPRAKGKPQ